MSAELKVEHLRKVFSIGRPAVDDVSFRAAAGEIVVLLGPSGCGKTTTLRCVAGLETPTSGEIAIGRDIGLGARARRAGAAAPAQYRHGVPVLRGVAAHDGAPERHLPAAPAQGPARGGRPEGRRVLELVGLSEYAERPVVALSGGQMQRVALARSLVYQPQLLLLDEPLSNLDAKLRLRLRDDLRRIIKQTGVTALYVTHDQAEAVVLGDRIGVMRDGKLLQIASPDEIYNRPADMFVANFTGASNALPGRLVDRNGEFGTVETASRQSPDGMAAARRLRPETTSTSRCGLKTSGSACRARTSPITSPPASPASAIRARRRSTNWRRSAASSKRSNSAPACVIRSAATSTSAAAGTLLGLFGERDRAGRLRAPPTLGAHSDGAMPCRGMHVAAQGLTRPTFRLFTDSTRRPLPF